MSKKRKNGEGTWGYKTIKGIKYMYFRNADMKYFYGKTEKEIKIKIEEYEEKYQKTPGNLLTLTQYMTWWLNEIKKIELSDTTIDGYEFAISRISKYNIGNYELLSLAQGMIQSFFNELAEKYSLETIKKTYYVLNACLDYAVDNKDLKVKPYNKIVLASEEKVEIHKKEAKFLTPEEMRLLYQESKRINIEGFNFGGKNGQPVYGINAYAVVFIEYTGLRVSELIALRWKDINLNKKEFTVTKSIVNTKNRNKKSQSDTTYIQKEKNTPKTKASIRTVPLCDIALEMLRYTKMYFPDSNENDYVFRSKTGMPLRSRNILTTLSRMITRCGCSECNVHGLRHSFGSLLIINGTNIKYVSEVLGHSDIATTYNIYINLTKDEINSVVRDSLNKSVNKE